MRIISGTARGTKLFTLEGNNTRPTLDRVKESFFNIIQEKIQNTIFLDLFSGSGAIGLEAVSRGAKKAILCDNSKDAIKIIKRNVEKTHLEEKVEVYNLDYKLLLNMKLKEKIDIAYIDPPYNSDFAIDSVEILLSNNLLNEDAEIIIETDSPEIILKKLDKMSIDVIDTRKYGRAVLIFCQK